MKALKYIISLLIPCALYLPSCSQEKILIKHIYTYEAIQTAGRKPVDLSGNEVFRPSDTIVIIYAEIKGNAPKWEHAWRNNQLYNISPQLIEQGYIDVGKDKYTYKTIYITPAAGNRLWRLELSPAAETLTPPIKKRDTEIIIQGRSNDKKFEFRINKVVKIQLPDAV